MKYGLLKNKSIHLINVLTNKFKLIWSFHYHKDTKVGINIGKKNVFIK